MTLGNQLGDLRTGTYGLDKYGLIGVRVHTIRTVKFLAALHKHVRGLLGLRISLGNDVKNIHQNRVRCSLSLDLRIIDRPICQQDGLIGGREGHFMIRLQPNATPNSAKTASTMATVEIFVVFVAVVCPAGSFSILTGSSIACPGEPTVAGPTPLKSSTEGRLV
jgi:hypothetical protein